MTTSNVIEKKPLSNAKKDNILNNFCELFEGSNQAYTIARTVQGKTNQKKVFAEYATIKKPPTQEHFINHLKGTYRLTNIPIRGDKCKFGAIDVDQYDGSADQIKERLNKDNPDLPLIAAASKSGGVHLYLFLEDWVMAKDVRRLLKHFASKLDLKSVDRKTGKEIEPEIFPKQDKLENNQYGNGINLPYYNSLIKKKNLTSSNTPSLEEWIKKALRIKMSVSKFHGYMDVIPKANSENTKKTKLVTHYEQLKTQSNDNGLKVMMELVRKQVDEGLILAMMKAKRPDPNPPNAFEKMLEATKKKLYLDQGDSKEKYKPYSATLLKNYTPKKTEYLIKGIVPLYGFGLTAGSPKIGKSWLELDKACAVANGKRFLGATTIQKDVLYLALEDDEQRLCNRLDLMKLYPVDLSRLQFLHRTPTLDQKFMGIIEKWAKEVQDPGLVIIDTLAHIKGTSAGWGNAYEKDYSLLHPLQSFAREKKLMINCVTHLKKGKEDDPLARVTGSYGQTGSADIVSSLSRSARNKSIATLEIISRDIPHQDFALEFIEENKDNSYRWINRGDSYQYKMGQERQVIKDCLEKSDKPLAPKEIAETIGKKTNAVSVLLRKMLESSEITQPEKGKYAVMNEKDIPF